MVFGHEHRKSQIETGCKISYAFRPIYFCKALGGFKTHLLTPPKITDSTRRRGFVNFAIFKKHKKGSDFGRNA